MRFNILNIDIIKMKNLIILQVGGKKSKMMDDLELVENRIAKLESLVGQFDKLEKIKVGSNLFDTSFILIKLNF
jgi:hypothetical protein